MWAHYACAWPIQIIIFTKRIWKCSQNRKWDDTKQNWCRNWKKLKNQTNSNVWNFNSLLQTLNQCNCMPKIMPIIEIHICRMTDYIAGNIFEKMKFARPLAAKRVGILCLVLLSCCKSDSWIIEVTFGDPLALHGSMFARFLDQNFASIIASIFGTILISFCHILTLCRHRFWHELLHYFWNDFRS